MINYPDKRFAAACNIPIPFCSGRTQVEKSGGHSLLSFYKASLDPSGQRIWISIFTATFLAAYLYAFLEWLFFITQPSYMVTSTNLWIKLSLFLFSGLVLAMAFDAVVAALFFFYLIIPIPKIQSFLLFAGRLVLSFILACLSLLLIDNFTYTLFNIGIINSAGVVRLAYGILFLALIAVMAYKSHPYFNKISKLSYNRRKWQTYTVLFLLILSLASVLTSYLGNEPAPVKTSTSPIDRPNILLIGSDGLNAANLSVYDYERETTPNLKAFASEALVARNGFSNSTSSASSITSMLTGKLPATTRVMLPPDILTGSDALEHLPGILKNEGYTNFEIGIPHYIDAYTMNMQNGFDIVNSRSITNYPILYAGWSIGGDYPFYFITITIERISSRLKHILFIKTMDNPYQEVTTGLGVGMTDRDRTDQIISFLESGMNPLFIHIHYDATHGPWFYPSEPHFSNSQAQTSPSDIDFYDDSILEFDRYFGEILSELEDLGIKENTIIIVYSDHAQNKEIGRLPWMIRFPEGQYAGVIHENVQNLDFAPTILDYMNIPIPAWMEGQSVLSTDLDAYRPIFVSSLAIDQLISDPLWVTLDMEKVKPPFYQFGTEKMIICNHYYELNLVDLTWSEGVIADHTAPCDPSTLPSLDEARSIIVEHLREKGFDVTSIVK